MRESPLRQVLLVLLAASGHSYARQQHDGRSSSGIGNGGSEDLLPTKAKSSPTTHAATTAESTCPSRTVNHITHTLAQQCLATSRSTLAAPINIETQALVSAVTVTISESQTGAALPPDVESSGAPASSRVVSATLLSSTVDQALRPAPDAVPASDEVKTELVPVDANEDPVSPFDNVNFLSFEEWKKQNLAKAGQSPEHVGQGYSQRADGQRQRPGINNALDALGEEGEIELDFAGFGGAANVQSHPPAASAAEYTSPDHSSPTAQSLRSKDAGKTCKERTNYASFDCAATVLKTNPECKSASSVLVENKDSYMLNSCAAGNKFFIVELCNDILIDTVVLANYEFFSSIFRQFRVSVSDRYPVKIDKWKELGTFEARNTREVQAFLIENPLIWARYLRIEFLSHYGSEYYCPLSLLRVHGTTMLEEFRHQEELARGENDDEQIPLEAEATVALPVAQEPERSTDESAKATLQAMSGVNDTKTPAVSSEAATDNEPGSAPPVETEAAKPDATAMPGSASITPLHSEDGTHNNATATSIALNSTTSTPALSDASETASRVHESTLETERPDIQPAKSSTSVSESTGETAQVSHVTGSIKNITHPEPAHSEAQPPLGSASVSLAASSSGEKPSSNQEVPPSSKVEVPAGISSTDPISRSIATTSSAPPAQPSTQESFYKSIHKRLQQLESNSTLSLQYIEEQSRILRDAFTKVERRQVATTSNFLSQLNESVTAELHGFRRAYDQLWQSTVLELDGQREQYQREMLALSSRLTLVADELLWQKRMGIAQSTLLLLCLAVVLFARGGAGSTPDTPLYQQVVNKSQAALGRAGWESPPASPSSQDRSPVRLLQRRIWRLSGGSPDGDSARASEGQIDDVKRPHIDLTPPTPRAGDVDHEVESIDEDDAEGYEPDNGPASPSTTIPGQAHQQDAFWSGGSGEVRT